MKHNHLRSETGGDEMNDNIEYTGVYGLNRTPELYPKGTVVLSFYDGAVTVHLKVNKQVYVTKTGSIIIKDKKLKVKKS